MKRARAGRRIFHRLGVGALALALTLGVFAPVSARAAGDTEADAIVAYPAMSQDKPKVVIQGNGVVDKSGKATGFYELALCVQTTFVYHATADGKANYDRGAVEWSAYQEALENAAKADEVNGGTTNVDDVKAQYVIVERPFQSVSATVTVNVEALTAVSWDEAYPTYYKWDKLTEKYTDDGGNTVTAGYPYGVSSTLEKKYDLTKVLQTNKNSYLRLDTARPDEVTYASAAVEYYDETNQTALIALTAGTDYQAPVNYTEPTPVAVIRFAYDKERFSQSVDKEVTTGGATKTYQDFWVGVNKDERPMTDGSASGGTPRTALTYLVEDAASAAATDERVSNPRAGVGQFALAQVGTSPENTDYTRFYYYLGGDGIGTVDFPSASSETKYVTRHNDVDTTQASVEKLSTVGETVLTWSDDGSGGYTYSYEPNLLTTKNGGFAMTYVNQETYRPATGGKGGVQILFYDWDDTLIGSLIVDETGDAREDVEKYVEANMVHPDLRTTATQYADHTSADYEALCDSIERQHTYRGEFSYMVGKTYDEDPARTYMRDDGEDYPLTNKLDYVFYKRINGVTHVTSTDDTGKTTETDYYTTNSLSQFEDGREYPYTYGWAIVAVENFGETFDPSDSGYTRQDAAKIEDTWTTIGVGEFEDYDPKPSTDPDKPDNPVPSTGGGITADTVKYPSWVDTTAATTPGGGAWNDVYQFTTSAEDDNAYLEFADFSDMEALVNHGGNKRDTVIVKAVYEPGEDLLTETHYTMTKSPYYNKWNNIEAKYGGAYSIEFSYGRYHYYEGVVPEKKGTICGVERVRSPGLRQDATSDIRWEETVDEDGNRETLTNPTTYDADSGKSKTTYIRAISSNTDVIDIELTASARQNRIDAFLVETYKLNIVSGGLLSDGNNSEKDADGKPTANYIIGNYNYFVEGDSDEADDYYDAPYENRSGTHGFVLYGTLNKLMEEATAKNHADKNESFLEASTDTVLEDINIYGADNYKADATNIADIRASVLAAAQEAEAHKGDANAAENYWNFDRDCAELSYHQLQWYILAPDQGLLDRATAEDDDHKLSWCHLHVSCAALVSNAPESWAELVDAAQNHPEYIDELTLNQATELAGLRQDANGTAFASLDEFKKAFVDAVTAAGSDTSWMNIQKIIIEQNLQKTDSDAVYDGDPYEDFWWAIASSKPSAPGSFEELVEALETWDTEQKLPDGTKEKGFTAQLAPLRDLVAANAKKTGEETDSKYVKATANLVANITEAGKPERFTSYDDSADGAEDGFLARVLKAYESTKSQNGAVDIDGDGDKDTDDYWYVLQRAIIAQSDSAESSKPNADLVERYYWKDGVMKIEDFTSMMAAAASNSAAWQKFSWTDYKKIVTEKNLTFKLNFDGTGDISDSEANFQALKTAINNFVEKKKIAYPENANWEEIQYWLLHSNWEDESWINQLNKESGYYWWEDGKTGSGQLFLGSGDLNNYITAAFKSAVNKNANAWENLTPQKMVTQLAYLKIANVSSYESIQTVTKATDLTYYSETDFETVKTELENLVLEAMKSATEKHEPPELNWYQVQHWLIEHTYGNTYGATDDEEVAVKKIWWYSYEKNPNIEQKNGFEEFRDTYLASATTVDTLTKDDLPGLSSSTEISLKYYNSSDFTVNNTQLRNLKKYLKAVIAGVSDPSTLTWYQVQCAILDKASGTYVITQADAKLKYIKHISDNGLSDWRPQWLLDKEAEASAMTLSIDSTEQVIASQVGSLDEEQKQQVLEYILNLLSGAKLSQSVSVDTSGSGSASTGTTTTPSQPSYDEESDSVEDNWFENIFRIEEETAETPMLEYSTTRRQASPGTVTVVSPMGAYLNPFM